MIRSQKECEAMIDDIEESCNYKSLSDWEIQFIDSVRKQVDEGKTLTPKQREVIDRIHSR